MEQTCVDNQEHTLFIILFPTLNHVPKNYFLLHVGAYLVPADRGSSVFVQSCYTTDLGYVVITVYCSSHFFLNFRFLVVFLVRGLHKKLH